MPTVNSHSAIVESNENKATVGQKVHGRPAQEPVVPEPAVGSFEKKTSNSAIGADKWQWHNANVDEEQVHIGNGGTERSTMSTSEFKRACVGMKLLSLFHGFRRPDDGLEHFAAKYGVEMTLTTLRYRQFTIWQMKGFGLRLWSTYNAVTTMVAVEVLRARLSLPVGMPTMAVPGHCGGRSRQICMASKG